MRAKALRFFELFITLMVMPIALVPKLRFGWLLGCFVTFLLCAGHISHTSSFTMHWLGVSNNYMISNHNISV